MRVRDVMCRPVSTCTEETSLAAAARTMAENDCGALPVLRSGKVVGVITDRDVCVGLGRGSRLPKEIPVREAMSANVARCGGDDEIREALDVMASRQVRRLPVVDSRGALEGILSLDDVVLRAEEPDPSRAAPAITCRDVVKTMRAIYGSRRVHPAVALSPS